MLSRSVSLARYLEAAEIVKYWRRNGYMYSYLVFRGTELAEPSTTHFVLSVTPSPDSVDYTVQQRLPARGPKPSLETFGLPTHRFRWWEEAYPKPDMDAWC